MPRYRIRDEYREFYYTLTTLEDEEGKITDDRVWWYASNYYEGYSDEEYDYLTNDVLEEA